MLMSSGYTAFVDDQLCEGCENCLDYCQFEAIEMVDSQAMIHSVDCFGCGVCVDQCQQGAIHLERDLEKGIPLEIKKLMDEAIAVS